MPDPIGALISGGLSLAGGIIGGQAAGAAARSAAGLTDAQFAAVWKHYKPILKSAKSF